MARSPDPRHAPVREAIAWHYALANNGLVVPWTGHTGAVLGDFLAANKSWSADVLVRCVKNRFASDEINPAEDPLRWIRKLPNYARGPLNRWGGLRKLSPEEVSEEYWKQKRGKG
jgi:hypothetical protein